MEKGGCELPSYTWAKYFAPPFAGEAACSWDHVPAVWHGQGCSGSTGKASCPIYKAVSHGHGTCVRQRSRTSAGGGKWDKQETR